MYEMHIRKEFHKTKLHYLQSSYMTVFHVRIPGSVTQS